jgi:hypothetical protein
MTRYGGSFVPRYPGDRGSGRSAESLHAVKGSGAWESKRNTPPTQSPAVTSLTGIAGNAAHAEGSSPTPHLQRLRQLLSPPLAATLIAAALTAYFAPSALPRAC